MSSQMMNRKIYVVGHKNPDTDSICSAIAYAKLKSKLTSDEYTPRRAGQLNEETQYVLNRFQVEAPPLLADLRVQVKDIDLNHVEGVHASVSIKTVWKKMKELNIHTLPVTRQGRLEGVITIGDIATSYMDVHDSSILSKARTQYRNIAAAIGGRVMAGNDHSYLLPGRVRIVASSHEIMHEFVHADDLVILENNIEGMQRAIDLNVACMVVCHGEEIAPEILEQATNRQIVVIGTPNDPFTVGRQMNQSIPVKQFMTKDNLVGFQILDYVDDVKEVMAHKRFRDFPVFNREGDFLGMISRRSLLHGRKKQVVLVDHNEKNQAVDGIDEAEVLEIIDHHRLSSIETMGPVFFRNQPVGCTATIVTQMYEEEGVEIDALTASLLCSAIISDTLMFRSPTCTPMDERYARKLAQIAGLNIEEHALGMFNAGSNLKGYSAQEILFLDFKEFTIGEISIGVGQVSSMSGEELKEIKEKVLPQMEEERQVHKLDMIFFMLTNILTESSELICCGQDARAKVIAAYDLRDADEQLQLKGVVSRKKQLIPTLVAALQQ